jgi:hypothetical protein
VPFLNHLTSLPSDIKSNMDPRQSVGLGGGEMSSPHVANMFNNRTTSFRDSVFSATPGIPSGRGHRASSCDVMGPSPARLTATANGRGQYSPGGRLTHKTSKRTASPSVYSSMSLSSASISTQLLSGIEGSSEGSYEGDDFYQNKNDNSRAVYDEYDNATLDEDSESDSQSESEYESEKHEGNRNPVPRKDGLPRPPRFSSAIFEGLSADFESGARPRPQTKRRIGNGSVATSSVADTDELCGPLVASRNSGGSLHNTQGDPSKDRRDTNKAPEFVNEDDVTDEWLEKRGKKRSAPHGSGKKIPKRSCGANDPENIQIVNLREQEDMSFAEIVKVMNARRTKVGKDPRLTSTGIANRYNRTAPLLFAAAGMKWVPLNMRKKGTQYNEVVWTPKMNKTLVRAVKKVESSKWEQVAKIFNAETGLSMDAAAVSAKFVTF